jgi:PLP dependent protein
VADRVACWQSIDRASLVSELATRAPGARILVQVGAPGDPGKGGADPADVPDLVARARDAGLDVTGLMAVGVAGDPEATADAFATTADLADHLDLPERSMGMSGDLAVAVRAGTTMVRVGTALFGPRPPRTTP